MTATHSYQAAVNGGGRRGASPALSRDLNAHCAGPFSEAGFVLRVPLVIVLCGCVAFAVSILLAAWLAIRATAFGVRQRAQRWLQFRRVCAWCQPMRYLGGNPFANQTTHGMCPKCLVKVKRQLDDERFAQLQASVERTYQKARSLLSTINS